MLEQNTFRLLLTLSGIIVLGLVIFAIVEYVPEIKDAIVKVFFNKPGHY